MPDHASQEGGKSCRDVSSENFLLNVVFGGIVDWVVKLVGENDGRDFSGINSSVDALLRGCH